MMNWQIAHVGPENDSFEIDGNQVWNHKWRPSPRGSVRLPSPQYPDHHRMFNIYEIGDEAKPVTFAAAEMSNGIFAFYRPTRD